MSALLERIKQNRRISGVKVGDFEFKLSAYADDTLCYLDGSVNSCRALFDDLGTFAKYSGLKPKIKKNSSFLGWQRCGYQRDNLLRIQYEMDK